MQGKKISPAHAQSSTAGADREPYEPPTVTIVPLKIEERLLACHINPQGTKVGNIS